MSYYSIADTHFIYSGGTALFQATASQTIIASAHAGNAVLTGESINIGRLIFVVATESPESRAILSDRAWAEFDALFERLDASGEVISDLDDEKLSRLRSSWGKRLRSLYEPDKWE